jgi:TRAP transporter TAXI family solute receptor
VKSPIRSSVLLLALLGAAPLYAAPAPIVIATGPVAGFAYPLGGEICRLYEKQAADKARCAVEATDGSVESLNLLRNGDIGLAIVQSDMAADALAATGAFAGSKPFLELRAIAGFYAQALTIIVKGDGPVKTVDDLKGRRIVVGEPGSPDPLFADFLEGLGWTKADLGGVVEMPRTDQTNALCSGTVAAVAIIAPHPNGFVREMLAACGATILDLAGPAIDTVGAQHAAYGPAHIDLGAYGHPPQIVQSLGTRAVLVTTAKTDDAVVRRLLAAVVGHIDDLKASHPAFAGLDAGLVSSGAGLGADRHPAAAKYFTSDKPGDAGGG